MKCGSINTIKWGKISREKRYPYGKRIQRKQRYYCKDCHSWFLSKKEQKGSCHTVRFKDELIRKYIENLSPYRILAKQSNLSPVTINRWLVEAGLLSKDPIDVARKLNPSWSGILGIDGKSYTVGSEEWVILIACDIGTQDIVHFDLVKSEGLEEIYYFLNQIKTLINYPFRGIISDLGKPMVPAVHYALPGIPHQACVVHFQRYVDATLPKKSLKNKPLNEELRTLINQFLFAPRGAKGREYFIKMSKSKNRFQTGYQRSIIKAVAKYFDLLTTHHRFPEIPDNNNITENIVGQLNKKLNLVGSFRSYPSAYATLKLLVMCYRFKRFTDSRTKENNGKSPLELAGVNLNNLDWLQYSKY